MAIIYAPNTEYNGISAGVQFKDGVGHTDDAAIILWMQEHGYTVAEDVKEDVKEDAAPKTKKTK